MDEELAMQAEWRDDAQSEPGTAQRGLCRASRREAGAE